MKRQPIRFERERSYPMPASEAWRLLADTDHLNRAIGLPPVRFSVHPDPLIRRARTRAFGVIGVRWRELPFDWVRERRYAVRREFEGGPVAVIEAGIELLPAGQGVTVRSFAECTPANVSGRLLWRLTRHRVTDLLDYCDRYLQRRTAGRTDPVPVPRRRPTVNTQLLGQRLGQLASAPVRPELARLLGERIAEGSDDQLTAIRPAALARAWGAGRGEVLRLLLYATKAGVCELRWELMCPTCQVPKAETGSLAAVPARFHCDTCGISYEADFDQRVELRFSVHPGVRSADSQPYCVGGPFRTPHALAQQYLGPHEERRVELALTGPAQLRTAGAAHRLRLVPGPAGPAPDVTLSYADGRWTTGPGLAGGEHLTVPHGAALVLRNHTSGAILAVIEDLGWASDATTAAEVTTLQEFRELFSSEVLAPGLQLAVSHITLLFSDLKGSTQLYEGIGDAAAYSRVRRHFDFITRAVTQGGGSVIKTLGDGVMCAFFRLDDALGTAIRLQQQVTGWSRAQGIDPPLVLKAGIHHGPVIAMTANDHLDYFGRTVNLAARVADHSCGGDVVVLCDVLGEADPALLRGHGITTQAFTARLRGLDGERTLARLTVPPAPAEERPAG